MVRIADTLVHIKGGKKWLNSLQTRKPRQYHKDRKPNNGTPKSMGTTHNDKNSDRPNNNQDTPNNQSKLTSDGPPKCFSFGRVGHIRRYCRTNLTKTQADPNLEPKPALYCGKTKVLRDCEHFTRAYIDDIAIAWTWFLT